MKLVGKVPVEPLDDERLTNIERRLVVHVSEMSQRPVRAPRRMLGFAAMAAAVLLAVFVGWKLHRDPALPAAKPDQLAMKAGALVVAGAEITGKDFEVTRSAGRVEITMRPGKLALHVDHDPNRLLVVKAGDVEIEDVGTRFSVDFDGKHVDVRVTEGEVKVKRAGKEEAVKAGDAWTIEIGRVAIAQLDEQRAAIAVNDMPPGNDVPPSDDVALTGDHATAVPPGSNSGGVPAGSGANASNGSGTGSSASANTSNGSGQGSGAHHKPGIQNAHKALEAAGLIAEPIDVGISDPAAAIVEYSQRAAKMASGDDTSFILYSMAVVQHRAKHDADALRTLPGVTRREGGKGYQAGMWLEVRIRCSQAFDEQCRRAAERYVQKFSSGTPTGIADAILREIRQQ